MSENIPEAAIPINVILASKSPRRKQLLEEAGVKFVVYTGTSEVDESLEPDMKNDPKEAVKKLAERKAGAVVQDILAQPCWYGYRYRGGYHGCARWRNAWKAL